ncbi:MAG: hypothetical protein K2L11_11005 [Muribaculaceae bacterium]|nr:hypothetical protein [Muribaculaceae bacterium]
MAHASKFKSLLRLTLMMSLLGGMMYSCKPTEKGYKQAYEAAKSKREQKDPDDDLLTGGHKLLNESSTRWNVIAGDSVQLQHTLIKPIEGSVWPQSGPYRLAVAMFKMTTNANSMLEDLKKDRTLTPVIATDGKDKFYIIAGSASYIDSLGNVLTTFKRENPGFQYIGLTPPQPVILVGR